MTDDTKLSALIPELYCTNSKKSLAFYVGVLGFKILYQREEEGFAMIEFEGAQIMLDEIDPNSKRSWIPAPLEKPFGRGMNLEIGCTNAAVLYDRAQKAQTSIFLPIEDKWYRANDVYVGVRQFIVQDPDGYLLRFSQRIGTKPVEA